MAFATVKDLESRWRILSEDEKPIAKTLLDDAEVFIRSVSDVDALGDDADAILKLVSCRLVRRAMSRNGDAYNVNNGEIDPMWTPTTAVGDWWLRADEKKMLGAFGRYAQVQL